MAKSADEIATRIQEITKAAQRLGPMLVGVLLEKRNRKKRKDSSTYVSAPYYTFQYKDSEGRRRWKRIPRALKAHVRKLVKTGAQYQALEQEYAGLQTALGLIEASKKND